MAASLAACSALAVWAYLSARSMHLPSGHGITGERISTIAAVGAQQQADRNLLVSRALPRVVPTPHDNTAGPLLPAHCV